MKTHLKNLIRTIITGAPAEVKIAQKQVEKFWHDYYLPNREKGRLAFTVFLEELKNFDQIKDADHQAYFINILKWPLWSELGEEYFETWADFFIAQIQNPSGKIRQAVIRATKYLIHDLRLDRNREYQRWRSKDLADKQYGEIVEKNIRHFGLFVSIIEDLLEKYQEPRFKRYKYVESLPIGVFKSLNLLMVDAIFVSDYYKDIYQDFLSGLRRDREASQGANNLEMRIVPEVKRVITATNSEINNDEPVKSMTETIRKFFTWLEKNQDAYQYELNDADNLFWGRRDANIPPLDRDDESEAFFNEWLMLDFSTNGYDNTVVSKRLNFLSRFAAETGNGLTDNGKIFANNAISSIRSFYRVTAVKPGENFEALDLFTNESMVVWDINLSNNLKVGNIVWSRHCQDETGRCIGAGSAVIIVPRQIFRFLKLLIIETCQAVNDIGIKISLRDFLKWNSYIYYRELRAAIAKSIFDWVPQKKK